MLEKLSIHVCHSGESFVVAMPRPCSASGSNITMFLMTAPAPRPPCPHLSVAPMFEPTVEQVLREGLRQYEKQIRPFVAAKQSRSQHNRHVSAQVTKMVTEKQKGWSTITTLNDLTLAVCSVLQNNEDGPFRSNFLEFAVEGRDRDLSPASSESSEDSEPGE